MRTRLSTGNLQYLGLCGVSDSSVVGEQLDVFKKKKKKEDIFTFSSVKMSWKNVGSAFEQPSF